MMLHVAELTVQEMLLYTAELKCSPDVIAPLLEVAHCQSLNSDAEFEEIDSLTWTVHTSAFACQPQVLGYIILHQNVVL